MNHPQQLDILLLILGFFALFIGAGALIKGASYLARRLGMSPLATGLTFVAFGTSIPELLVTMTAGLKNNSDLAIANVLGSNIANILLVLGVAAIIRPLPIRNSVLKSEIPFSLAAALLVGFLANAALFSTQAELSINRSDGVILLFFFLLYMLYVYKFSHDNTAVDRQSKTGQLSITQASIYLFVGMLALYWGGQWTVTAAGNIAHQFGLEDAIIGLTIVAIGTSSPELVTSAVAAYKNQTDIAVGNVVGSNIFNLLWVLGLTSSFVELPFNVLENTDLVMMIIASALLIFTIVSNPQNELKRLHGILAICVYAAYLIYVVNR